MGKRSLHHRIAPVVVLAIAALAYWCGALEFIERDLMDSRFRLVRRAPSDSLVIVTIDPRSMRELPAWPWPRNYHAQLLDNLFTAGAATVGVDIDFSSRSTEAADQALAAAIARHRGRVVLPAFLQLETDAGGHPLLHETFPNPLFRESAQIGAVSVHPATDSLVRQLPYAEMFGNTAIPSLASRLAGIPDADPSQFYLDYGIRIRAVPRLSYVDVLNGTFDPKAVAGKNVLIGATAVEMGDQFAVPVYRVLPGPLLQALGYESLLQHRALSRTGALPSFAAAGSILLLLMKLSPSWGWRRHLLGLAAIWTALYAVTLAAAAIAPVSIDVAMPAAAALLYCLFGCLRQFEQQARLLLKQRIADMHRRALIQSVLEDSFDGILVADADGKIEIANQAAGRLLKQSPAEMLGMPVDAFLPVPAASREQLDRDYALHDDFEIVPAAPVEIELPQTDGGPLTLELALSRSRVPLDGSKEKDDRVFLTYTFRDISERRRSEQAVQTAMQEAVAANRAKTEFLANMSHELRTPLNAIIGFSEMIHGEIFGAMPSPRYREYAGDITDSGKHLLEVINEILDMAKIESGEFQLEEDVVKLADLVERCLRLARGAPGAARLGFEKAIPDELPQFRADPRLIRQAIINVLANAVKFTPEGGTISVAVARVDFGLVVRITDTGIGIPADEIPRVLRPFYQVDSQLSRRYEGTGLGLALVNAYLELHQGKLVIESVVGKGTTVSLFFPASRFIEVRAPQPA
jgi:PAS domain S-box-containing protein